MDVCQKVGRIITRTMLKRKLSQQLDAGLSVKNSRKSPDHNPSSEDTSNFFSNNFSEKFINIQSALNSELKPLQFKPPVAYIYNPVEYASKANETYIKKYCQSTKKLLFVGMNPGPFGMCQTGVPFGEVKAVRDWLKISEEIGKPEKECPQRPVLGFACPKSEVSGDRLWNVLKKLCGSADIFFKNCFVYNYCPLALLKNDGGNITPGEIKDGKKLEDICDKYFYQIIQLLQPEIIIGIGRYAEKRTILTLKNYDNNSGIKVICLPHPSPRAVNNQNWKEKAEKFFQSQDLLKFMVNGESN